MVLSMLHKTKEMLLWTLGLVAFVVFFALPGFSRAAAPVPDVVVTIKPLHGLASALMQGVGSPYLLIRGNMSPHTYALKPSAAARIERADIVFMIGPELETSLVSPLSSLAASAQIVALGQGAREAFGETDNPDPHVWLDPLMAAHMVDAMEGVLVRTDPAHATTYKANADRLQDRLNDLHQRLAQRLAPVSGVPFITFHEAYTYFEKRYHLAGKGSISLSEQQRPGARHIRELQQMITARDIACVFAEPQFSDALVDLLVEGSGARKAVLDPLGIDLAPGPELYFELMDGLADTFHACLSGGSAPPDS